MRATRTSLAGRVPVRHLNSQDISSGPQPSYQRQHQASA